MKTLFKTVILATSLASTLVYAAETAPVPQAGQQQPKPYTYKTPKLSRAEVDALLAKPAEVLVIDVRRPDEISQIGSFPVYLNVQLKEIESALPFIPKDRKIITVSNHANRAGAAGDLLSEKGLKVAGAVGSQNYEEEGGKITRIAIPPKPQQTAAAGDEHAAHHP